MGGKMIDGIGIDIVRIEKFRSLVNDEFILRYFSENERSLRIEKLAGRFAAKEALFKALDVQELFRWDDVEVILELNGSPKFNFKNHLAHYAQDKNIHLSISHSNHDAIAVVIIENLTT
jgi:holo-[acyl-carrier protein] synthase